jgi:hypothetical protein
VVSARTPRNGKNFSYFSRISQSTAVILKLCLMVPQFSNFSLVFLLLQVVRFFFALFFPGEPGSSGSVVSDYGLDDRAIGVRSPAGAKDFPSSFCVQTGSGVHPASCTMGTGGPFPGGKARPGRDADHPPPSSAGVVN